MAISSFSVALFIVLRTFSTSLLRRLRTGMLLVVVRHADLPEVGFHGGAAAGSVLLGVESRDVGVNLRHVLLTCFHRGSYSSKTLTDEELVDCWRCAALDLLAKIQTVTLVTAGGCGTMRTQQHLDARVLTALARFR